MHRSFTTYEETVVKKRAWKMTRAQTDKPYGWRCWEHPTIISVPKINLQSRPGSLLYKAMTCAVPQRKTMERIPAGP